MCEVKDKMPKWLSRCGSALLCCLSLVSFLGCNDSNSSLPANPVVTHEIKNISVTTSEDGYILKSDDNQGEASIVNGPPDKRTMTLRQLYEGMLYAPTQVTLEAKIDGIPHRWTGEIGLLSSDASTRKSSFSFRMVTPVQVRGSKSQKSSDALPPQMDQSTLILQSCPNEYPPCNGDYLSSGEEVCPYMCGTITSQGKVGYCWWWESLSCHPCQDYTSYCYSDGICASGRLHCGLDACVADNEPCYQE